VNIYTTIAILIVFATACIAFLISWYFGAKTASQNAMLSHAVAVQSLAQEAQR
jgi:hypothetical protein